MKVWVWGQECPQRIQYTNNEISERECKQAISFKIAPKKYSGKYLTKEEKDLYTENYKTLRKKI